ncbi:hypothetical protein [Photobacterium phosphoreum]|uniref:hypothetical protein n=1 Tax=Photobacterium phosphoreum TaxID=659 RepID=UPI001E5E3FE5|nr:hypothetical protein [Photobacterium phosphoreum]
MALVSTICNAVSYCAIQATTSSCASLGNHQHIERTLVMLISVLMCLLLIRQGLLLLLVAFGMGPLIPPAVIRKLSLLS